MSLNKGYQGARPCTGRRRGGDSGHDVGRGGEGEVGPQVEGKLKRKRMKRMHVY